MTFTSVIQRLAAGLALTLGLAICGFQAKPASANDPAAECMGSGGIYVYILYEGSLVTSGCATAGTGYNRIKEVTSAEQTGGFICRIAGLPEKCVAPHAGMDVYWSYWWWRNGAWTYASVGGNYAGIPGTAEAWNYSAGLAPGIVPPAPQAPQAPPPPPPAPTNTQPPAAEQPTTQAPQPHSEDQRPTDNASTQAATSSAVSQSPATTISATSQPARPSSSSPKSTPSAVTSPSASTTAQPTPGDSSGTPWPTLIVLTILAAGTCGYLLWRQRK